MTLPLPHYHPYHRCPYQERNACRAAAAIEDGKHLQVSIAAAVTHCMREAREAKKLSGEPLKIQDDSAWEELVLTVDEAIRAFPVESVFVPPPPPPAPRDS